MMGTFVSNLVHNETREEHRIRSQNEKTALLLQVCRGEMSFENLDGNNYIQINNSSLVLLLSFNHQMSYREFTQFNWGSFYLKMACTFQKNVTAHIYLSDKMNLMHNVHSYQLIFEFIFQNDCMEVSMEEEEVEIVYEGPSTIRAAGRLVPPPGIGRGAARSETPGLAAAFHSWTAPGTACPL